MQPKTFHLAHGSLRLSYTGDLGTSLVATIEELVNGRPVDTVERRTIAEPRDLFLLLCDAGFPDAEAERITRVEWTWMQQTRH